MPPRRTNLHSWANEGHVGASTAPIERLCRTDLTKRSRFESMLVHNREVDNCPQPFRVGLGFWARRTC